MARPTCAPDVATLNLAIETHAATAQQSAGQNAALAQKVVDALNTKLQGKGKVWTGGYSLYPEYNEPRPNEKPAVTGYRSENSITVETGEIGMLGGLIDTAIEAGANRINFLNFTLRDESPGPQPGDNAGRQGRADAGRRARQVAWGQARAGGQGHHRSGKPADADDARGSDGDELVERRADAGAAQRSYGSRDRFDYLSDRVARRVGGASPAARA